MHNVAYTRNIIGWQVEPVKYTPTYNNVQTQNMHTYGVFELTYEDLCEANVIFDVFSIPRL